MDKSVTVTDEVMERINEYAVKPLTAEQVYCFCVLLCDNEIDRDEEKFSVPALRKLAELFRGRTGIFDHDPRGENQTARIYQTEIKTFPERLTADGEEYTALMGYAYMVRTEDNRSLIAEIDGGIKKEVSVSCAVSRKTCSVCGCNRLTRVCEHVKGAGYGSKRCFCILEEPTDAYEWSFVAVPAQRNAGVAKSYREEREDDPRQALISEIIRLSLFAGGEDIRSRIGELDIRGLTALRDSLRSSVSKGRAPGGSCPKENNDYYRIR